MFIIGFVSILIGIIMTIIRYGFVITSINTIRIDIVCNIKNNKNVAPWLEFILNQKLASADKK